MLADLRRQVAALERPLLTLEDGPAAVGLGVSEVDRVLGGGLARGALHEIAAFNKTHLPAATGFAVGLGRIVGGTIVWIAEDMGLAESGELHGPGLEGAGIPPERLLTVATAHRRDLLWTMEEALRCRSVSVVVGEMRTGALDSVVSRRLSLAAAESDALALLLRTAPPKDASTAATRWIVGAAPQLSEETSGPTAAFAARLIRNRRGPLGSWILTWSDADGFKLTAHTQSLVATPVHRAHRAVA